jgi:hypothetical protein
MAKLRDPEDIAASILRSIEVSPKGSRRVRCHTLRALFGFQAWNASRKELVATLLEHHGIRAQPPIGEADVHDWILLSVPVPLPFDDSSPDPRPSDKWFEQLMSVHLDTELEVEMYFASPLFHGLGYTSEQESAGYRFDMWEGVARRHVEADLVYFENEHRSHTEGVPLVLVEVKGTDKPPDAGKGQAQSYANWIRPAYYVITNGNVIAIYSYQAPAPDLKVLDIKRSELRDRFDELYRILNPKAAKAAWVAKQEKFKEPNHPAI